MKLRPSVRFRQNLSLLAGAFLLSGAAFAQTDAELVLRNDEVQRVKVFGVSSSGLQLDIATPDGKGRFSRPLAQIKEVRMAAPAELNQALTQYQEKKYDAAIAALRALLTKYRGMPASWVQQASATLGSVYLAKGDLAGAEAAFRDFQKLYPGQGSLQSDVGMALVAVAKKDFASARPKLEAVAEKALKEKNVNAGTALAYSATFLGLGQIQEAEGNPSEALEHYLRTVTLFYHDRAAAALAQERADALRVANKNLAVP